MRRIDDIKYEYIDYPKDLIMGITYGGERVCLRERERPAKRICWGLVAYWVFVAVCSAGVFFIGIND